MIIVCVVDLVFACIHNTADPTVWKTNLIGIMGGAGLIFARDSKASEETVRCMNFKIGEVEKKVSGDTDRITKPPPQP